MHDWLQTWAGAEHVLREIVSLYPAAEVFTLVDFLSAEDRSRLGHVSIRTSFLQHVPKARTSFRRYLPLFPTAIESLDVSSADVIISNSHAVAKGVRKRPGQLHLCYCYTPMRYAWDLRGQYLAQVGLDRGIRGWVAGRALDRIRGWDRRTSAAVDHFIAISGYIAERIERALLAHVGSHLPAGHTGERCCVTRSASRLRHRVAPRALQAHRPDRGGVPRDAGA